MESIKDFFDMGGYGAFVWPAFAASAVTLALLLLASFRSLKADEKTLKMLQASQPSRRRSAETSVNEEEKE